MEQLVVFDVDGTLCDTCGVDDEMFRAATSAQLGVPIHPAAWRHAPHVTDTGISDWLWTQHRGRVPTPGESEEFAVAFESLLRAERDRAPARFVGGAVTPIALGGSLVAWATVALSWVVAAPLLVRMRGADIRALRSTA